MGLGIVVRGHIGEIYAALRKRCMNVLSVEVAELVAGFEAVTFAFEAKFMNLVLEGDTLAVIHTIRSKEDGLSSEGALVADIHRMGAYYSSVSVSFVK